MYMPKSRVKFAKRVIVNEVSSNEREGFYV